MSSEIFAEKVLSAQASSSAAAAKASFEKACTSCQKTYYSENAFRNHLGSLKHRQRLVPTKNAVGPKVDDDTNSVVGSIVSLGEPLDSLSNAETHSEGETMNKNQKDGMKDMSPNAEKSTLQLPERPLHTLSTNKQDQSLSVSQSQPIKVTEDASAKRCLFCNYDSPSLKLNILHMTKFHAMFIPEQQYLVDLAGLITYFHDKINKNHECLLCHKLKATPTAVQTHMRDVGHCMVGFDTEEEMIEVGQFYDFRSTYSDSEDDLNVEPNSGAVSLGGGVKLGSNDVKSQLSNSNGKSRVQDDNDENADGWETDSSASSLDSEELGALTIDHDHAFARLPNHLHHSHNDPRPHRCLDGFHSHAHSHHAVFYSDHELHLPTGRTAGHRSLNRYYRQNLYNRPSPQERIDRALLTAGMAGIEYSDDEDDTDDDGNTTPEQEAATVEPSQPTPPRHHGRGLATRANGGTGMIGVTEAKKREVVAAEKRERKRAQRAEKQYQWGVDKRGNSQKHFRDPLLQ